MKKFLIDSDTISYLADTESPYHDNVIEHFHTLLDNDVIFLSILTLYELHYSIAKAENSDIIPAILETKKAICAAFPLVPLSEEGASIFGLLKSKYQKRLELKKKALSQNSIDLMLASTAIEIGAILVSNDKIFQKIQEIEPTLQLENWTQ